MTSPQAISDRTTMFRFTESLLVSNSVVRYYCPEHIFSGVLAGSTLSVVSGEDPDDTTEYVFLIESPHGKWRLHVFTDRQTSVHLVGAQLVALDTNTTSPIYVFENYDVNANTNIITKVANSSVLSVETTANKIVRLRSSSNSTISTALWSSGWGASLPNGTDTINSRLVGQYGTGVGLWNYTGTPLSNTPTIFWAGASGGVSICRAVDTGTDVVVASAAHNSTVLNISRVDYGLVNRTTRLDSPAFPSNWTAVSLRDMRVAWNNGRLFVVVIPKTSTINNGVPRAHWAMWNGNTNTWSPWQLLHTGQISLTGTFEGLTMARYPETDRLFIGIQTSTNFYYYNVAIDHEPHTPTWGTAARTYNRDQELVLVWTYSDPTDDPMGGYQLRRTSGGTTHYINASGQWVTAETTVDEDTRSLALTAGWGTDGQDYTFTIRVKDDQGNYSAWSNGLTISAGTIGSPTITTPASNGATVTSTSFEWTTPTAQHGWRGLVHDSNDNLLADTGWNLLLTNRALQTWSPSLIGGDDYVLTIHWQDADGLRAQAQRTFDLDIVGVPTPSTSITMKDQEGNTVTPVNGIAVNAILAEITVSVPKLNTDGTDGADPQSIYFRRREVVGTTFRDEQKIELPIAESDTDRDFVYMISDHTIGHNRLYQWRAGVTAVNGELTLTDWFPT